MSIALRRQSRRARVVKASSLTATSLFISFGVVSSGIARAVIFDRRDKRFATHIANFEYRLVVLAAHDLLPRFPSGLLRGNTCN